MKQGFWLSIPHSSKMDELLEKKHIHLLENSLKDSQTFVYRSGRDEYFISGEIEALLFRPKSFVWKMALELYASMCGVITNKQRQS